MKFSFLTRKNKLKHMVVFSVETGFVTMSVVNLKADLNEQIVYVAKYPFTFDESPSGGELVKKVISKIDEAYDDASKNKAVGYINKADVVVLLGSPWNISWCDRLNYNKDKPFKVNDDVIDKVINDAFEHKHQGFRMIGKHVMGYKMNGYIISNPIGKTTSSLELCAYVEYAPEEIIDQIKSRIVRRTPHSRIYFTTSTFSAAETIKYFTNTKDFLLILPESEVTDLVVVRHGIIESTSSIPFGSATLARKLFNKESATIDEAISKTKRFLASDFGSDELEKLRNDIESVKNDFIKIFRDLLWKMNETVLLPQDLYIANSGVLAHFIKDWVEKEDYSNEAFTVEGFKVRIISGKEVAESLAIEESVSSIPFETISASVIGRYFETK